MKNLIYVQLLNEGSLTFLPLNSLKISDKKYQILETKYDQTDIFPEFTSGDIVEVRIHDKKLFATKKINNLKTRIVYIKDKSNLYFPIPAFAEEKNKDNYVLIKNNYTWNQEVDLEFKEGEVVHIDNQFIKRYNQILPIAKH